MTMLKDKIDTVTVDIPLLIRLFEYSKEDAKTDMDLHTITENIIKLSKTRLVLTMENYNDIVNTHPAIVKLGKLAHK